MVVLEAVTGEDWWVTSWVACVTSANLADGFMTNFLLQPDYILLQDFINAQNHKPHNTCASCATGQYYWENIKQTKPTLYTEVWTNIYINLSDTLYLVSFSTGTM